MQPVVDSHDRVVRWRQVVDLLSRMPEEFDEAIADAGFALVEREALSVPEEVRAATARNVASRPAVFRMVALFARDRLSVAAPVLAAAHLSANEWATIARDCSPEVASFIQTVVRGGEPLREASFRVEEADPEADAVVDVKSSDEPPSISQMVARIEQLRSRRSGDQLAPTEMDGDRGSVRDPRRAATSIQTELGRRPAVSAPLPIDGALFRWESDPTGQIAWVDGVPRGAFVGSSLSGLANNEAVRRAVHAREPFHTAPTNFDVPAIEGEWQLSGIPAFSPRDGRFLGYRGIGQRSDVSQDKVATPQSREDARVVRPRNVDALRETIHEIKTPLNAIIGFAEIIDGQYLGPAHRNYRQRAAGIVAQARTLLEAIQDMEIVARGHAAADGTAVTSVNEILGGLTADWRQRAERRGVVLTIHESSSDLQCGVGPELGRRLVKRFVDSIVDAGENGERLIVDVSHDDRMCHFSVTRPRQSDGVSEAILLNTDHRHAEGGDAVLGLGFALSLIRGLARLVDGHVAIEDDKFVLGIPRH